MLCNVFVVLYAIFLKSRFMEFWESLRTSLNDYCDNNRGAMTDLAEHLDVHYQSVQRWLTGTHVPSYEIGKKMEAWLKEQK